MYIRTVCMCCVFVRTYVCYTYAQGWEDVAHLKDEMATQQTKMDSLKVELTNLEQAENSLKVGQLEAF